MSHAMTIDDNRSGPQTIALDVALDASSCGHKASTLAELRNAGHNVPDGFVIPVGGACSPEALEREALERLGPGPYAVRSSGVAEDLGDASFAGQVRDRARRRHPRRRGDGSETGARVWQERARGYLSRGDRRRRGASRRRLARSAAVSPSSLPFSAVSSSSLWRKDTSPAACNAPRSVMREPIARRARRIKPQGRPSV